MSNQENANGMRMYMNAFLTPTDLLGSLQFSVVAQCLTTLNDPTIINVNSATGPTSAYPLTFTLYADISAPFGQQNAGDVLIGSAVINSPGGPASQITIPATGPLSIYRRNTPYVMIITPPAGCLQPVTFIPNQCISSLPVNLVSFEAKRIGHQVNLKWKTGSESNNKGFQVERLIGAGSDWQTVGFVNSLAIDGNSSTELNYSFTDDNNVQGVAQYSLRQIDNDYRYKFSEVRSVKGLNQSGRIIVYPNPSNDGKVNVVFEDASVTRDVSVMDMSGRVVRQMKGIINNNVTIDNLQPGMYTLRITAIETGEQAVEKVVVNKR